VIFFKKIVEDKMGDTGFRTVFEKECHICSTTVRVIADLEERKSELSEILATLGISRQAYEDLKDAESCDPRMVQKLCQYLGFTDPELFENCRRLNSSS